MKKYFDHKSEKWGVTLALSLMAVITFYFILLRWSEFNDVIGKLNNIMMPFVFGLALAYIVTPSYNFFVRNLIRIHWPKRRGVDKSLTYSRGLATVLMVLEILVVIGALLWLIIPQLIDSITTIATNLPAQIQEWVDWFNGMAERLPDMSKQADIYLHRLSDSFIKWVEEGVLPSYNGLISGVSEGVIGVARVTLNFIIGIIICVFFVIRKEIFLAQCKKLVLAVFSMDTAEGILRGASFANKTFWGFFSGKLIDSTIIGIICFIVMAILHWPYAALISVIIGVTNIIPFFGPFIGAIPSSLLMLMESPRLFIFFLIFVFILQQFDGNILGPLILGESTGLSSFWVMFAILVGGGLFGFLGMILGVPVFAVIYAYLCYWVDRRLQKKGLSIVASDYRNMYRYNGIAPNDRLYEALEEEGILSATETGLTGLPEEGEPDA